jgi:hypothetical protein
MAVSTGAIVEHLNVIVDLGFGDITGLVVSLLDPLFLRIKGDAPFTGCTRGARYSRNQTVPSDQEMYAFPFPLFRPYRPKTMEPELAPFVGLARLWWLFRAALR